MSEEKGDFDRRVLLGGAALGAALVGVKSAGAQVRPNSDDYRSVRESFREFESSARPAYNDKLKLAEERPESLSLLNSDEKIKKSRGTFDKQLPDIIKPMDTGADKLLNGLSSGALVFSPYDIEYLTNTLEEHIRNCIKIRSLGQELEVQALLTKLSAELDSELLNFADLQKKFDFENGHLQLDNLVRPKIDKDSGVITGDNSSKGGDENYFKQQKNITEGVIKTHRNNIQNRNLIHESEGSGANYVERFSFQKEMFDLELKEAFKRARTVSVGLKHVYGIDISLPDIADIGFLDSLAVWVRRITYRLEKALLGRTKRTTIIPFWIEGDDNLDKSLMKKADYEKNKGNGIHQLRLTSKLLKQYGVQENSLLRSIDVVTWLGVPVKADYRDTSRMDRLPVTITLNSEEISEKVDGAKAMLYSRTPKVILNPISPLGVNDMSLIDNRAVHNHSLNSDMVWQAVIGSKGTFGATPSYENLGLVLSFTTEA